MTDARVAAPVRVVPAWGFLAPDCWTALCGPCGDVDGPHIVWRSERLDTPGWTGCMTAARQHVAWHQAGTP